MDFIYFLVTGNEAWEGYFHENFFMTQNGFWWGIIGAFAIAAIFALIFYFGFCNSKTSNTYAKIWLWGIFLALSGGCSYFYADLVVIGDPAQPQKDDKDRIALLYKYSFYKANNDYYTYITDDKNGYRSQKEKEDLKKQMNTIKDNLNKGKDVRNDFDITTAAWSLIFFYLISLGIKRFTINGKCIPHA